MGRPSTFTQAIADEICERLSKGEPLAAVCRDEGMPHPTTFRHWCEADESLAIAYGRAREDGFDAIAVDALNIADQTADDTIRDPENGSERPNTEWITRSRLRVDTRLKLLAKWDPKRYGDKTLVGSDPDNPLPAGFHLLFEKPDAAASEG
jgi:hypothetical protein